jgi:hypothetical protein
MAVGNPCVATSLDGEHYTFYSDGTEIYFTSAIDGDAQRIALGQPPLGRPDPVYCFDQEVEDSPIDMSVWPTGQLQVTYLDEDGNRLIMASDLDGIAGSWYSWPPPP